MLAFPILVIAIYGLLTAHARIRRGRPLRIPPDDSVHLSATFQPPPVVRRRAAAPVLVQAPLYVPLAPPRVAVPPPPAPPPVWHGVLSRDAEEQALLVALRERPDDAGTRLVYGDMLEGRGQLAEAQFVRGAPMRLDALVALARAEPAWRAITSCTRVACTRDDCPGTWSALEPSPIDETVRTCRTCDKPVRHCGDRQASRDALARGEQVVIELVPPPPLKREVGLDFDLSD